MGKRRKLNELELFYIESNVHLTLEEIAEKMPDVTATSVKRAYDEVKKEAEDAENVEGVAIPANPDVTEVVDASDPTKTVKKHNKSGLITIKGATIMTPEASMMHDNNVLNGLIPGPPPVESLPHIHQPKS